MKLEEAIKTAIEYETRVHSVYEEAADKATDDKGKKVFGLLAKEEQGHVDYLESRLVEWKKTGHIEDVAMDTFLPSKKVIEAGVAKLKEQIEPRVREDLDVEMGLLQQALQVEVETSNFYRKMVGEMDGEGKRLFERFLQIEEGHQAVVQGEIDSLSGLGFWFDTTEFSLEGG
jgi:rubrerythrin